MWDEYFHHQVLSRVMKDEKIDWRSISAHPYLPVQVVGKYPSMPWDWRAMSRVAFEKVRPLIMIFPKKDWDWEYLTMTSPRPFIEENPHLKWYKDRLAIRKESFEELHTPLHYILSNQHMPWNWKALSRHPSLTMDHVVDHPHLPWDMEHILLNCAFSSYHLSQFDGSKQHYRLLSKNPHNTLPILRKYHTKPWSWSDLAQNIAFAPHVVYPHRQEFPRWRWDLSMRNPRLTWSFYHFIRKEIVIPHQFQNLVKNNFEYATFYWTYFLIIIRRFLVTAIRRRVMKRKLRVITLLKRRLDPHLLSVILFTHVG
jgi:hypothetical protein